MKKGKKGNDDNSSTMMHLTGIVNKPKGFDNSLNTHKKYAHKALSDGKNGMSTVFFSRFKNNIKISFKIAVICYILTSERKGRRKGARERARANLHIGDLYISRVRLQCSHLRQTEPHTQYPIARDFLFVFEWHFKWLSIKLRLNRYRLRQSLSLRFTPLSRTVLGAAGFFCDCLLFEQGQKRKTQLYKGTSH